MMTFLRTLNKFAFKIVELKKIKEFLATFLPRLFDKKSLLQFLKTIIKIYIYIHYTYHKYENVVCGHKIS